MSGAMQCEMDIHGGHASMADQSSPADALARVAAAKASLRRAARDQAARAIAGTPGGAEGRTVSVGHDAETGETTQTAAEGLIQHLGQSGMLTARQCAAAEYLARLYGIGGGRVPWRRADGPGRPDATVAAARREFSELLDAAPIACRADLTVLAMGEWVVSHDPRPNWRTGLDAIAARLKLA